MDDDSKRIVLARRARFIAAALASAGLLGQACGLTEREHQNTNGSGGSGQGCLSLSTGGSGGSFPASGGAVPCLSIASDAGADAATDAESDAGPSYCEQGGAGGQNSAGGEGGASCIPAGPPVCLSVK